MPKRVFFLGGEGDAAGGIVFEAASEGGRFYVKCAGIFPLSFLCVWDYDGMLMGCGVGAPLGVLNGYLYAHMVAPGMCRALMPLLSDTDKIGHVVEFEVLPQ